LNIKGSGFSTITSAIKVSVDENECEVVSSSLTQIECNLKPRNTSLNTKLDTNSGSQKNGYFSGTGLNYRRYDISKLSPQTTANLRTAINNNSPQLTLQ